MLLLFKFLLERVHLALEVVILLLLHYFFVLGNSLILRQHPLCLVRNEVTQHLEAVSLVNWFPLVQLCNLGYLVSYLLYFALFIG